MKKYLVIAFLGIMTFIGCTEDDDSNFHPTLMIVNEIGDTSRNIITSVSLVDYEFRNLNILKGESQTFILEKGMVGGYNDIYVSVGHGRGGNSTKVNFQDGKNTTITLKGCSGFEGCQGHYLD